MILCLGEVGWEEKREEGQMDGEGVVDGEERERGKRSERAQRRMLAREREVLTSVCHPLNELVLAPLDHVLQDVLLAGLPTRQHNRAGHFTASG